MPFNENHPFDDPSEHMPQTTGRQPAAADVWNELHQCRAHLANLADGVAAFNAVHEQLPPDSYAHADLAHIAAKLRNALDLATQALTNYDQAARRYLN